MQNFKQTHEDPREANKANTSGKHEDKDEDHLEKVVTDDFDKRDGDSGENIDDGND